jgi:hypothetical protein
VLEKPLHDETLMNRIRVALSSTGKGRKGGEALSGT